ncbi:MarR family winged helix-turn-helix transcriptional regulator [Geodermatophilus sp. SYSU D00815]
MSVTPATCERITSCLSQLVRTGRHLAGRPGRLPGELPSFGTALLVPLEREGALRLSALAQHAGVDPSVASRQIAVLERAGHVERRPDPHDGRASLLSLTPAGAAALAATRAERAHWAVGALADWEETDAQRLGELLERLTADLEAATTATGRSADTVLPAPAGSLFPTPQENR